MIVGATDQRERYYAFQIHTLYSWQLWSIRNAEIYSIWDMSYLHTILHASVHNTNLVIIRLHNMHAKSEYDMVL